MAFVVDSAERCVCCGIYIPEGRQVCPLCEAKLNDPEISEVRTVIEEKGKDD